MDVVGGLAVGVAVVVGGRRAGWLFVNGLAKTPLSSCSAEALVVNFGFWSASLQVEKWSAWLGFGRLGEHANSEPPCRGADAAENAICCVFGRGPARARLRLQHAARLRAGLPKRMRQHRCHCNLLLWSGYNIRPAILRLPLRPRMERKLLFYHQRSLLHSSRQLPAR